MGVQQGRLEGDQRHDQENARRPSERLAMSAAAETVPLTPDMARIFESPDYRLEGRLKVTGGARYAGDVILPGMLWARFLKSPFPHARIVSIDTSEAQKLPGVHAVLTGEDVGHRRFGRYLFDWPVLAFDRVLYAGERLAAVAADTKDAA